MTNNTYKQNINDMMGAKLKELRKSMGLTITHLADEIKCTPQQISKYENGKGAIPLYKLMLLSRVLGQDLILCLLGKTLENNFINNRRVVYIDKEVSMIEDPMTRERLLNNIINIIRLCKSNK